MGVNQMIEKWVSTIKVIEVEEEKNEEEEVVEETQKGGKKEKNFTKKGKQ